MKKFLITLIILAGIMSGIAIIDSSWSQKQLNDQLKYRVKLEKEHDKLIKEISSIQTRLLKNFSKPATTTSSMVKNEAVKKVKTKTTLPAVIESEIEKKINDIRAENKLPKYEITQELKNTAEIKVNDEIENNYFAHSNSWGDGVDSLFIYFKIPFIIVGENLSNGYEDSEVVNAWLDSPTHKANILDENFKKMGCFSKNFLIACHFKL